MTDSTSFGLSPDQRDAERIFDALLAASANTGMDAGERFIHAKVRLQAATEDDVRYSSVIAGFAIAGVIRDQPTIESQSYYPPSGGTSRHGTAHIRFEVQNHKASALHDLLASNKEAIKHAIRLNPILQDVKKPPSHVTRLTHNIAEFPVTRSR